VPLKRAELAIKWLTLIKESVNPVVTDATAPPAGRKLNEDVIRQIKEIYGIYDDPKLPNTPVETSD